MSIDVNAAGAGTRVSRMVISVSDLDRALGFYCGPVGLSLRRRDPGFAYLATADGLELLLHERPAQPSMAGVAVTFLVADLDAVFAGIVGSGGSVLKQPERQPWGERMAVVQDPDGHVVCLSAAG